MFDIIEDIGLFKNKKSCIFEVLGQYLVNETN